MAIPDFQTLMLPLLKVVADGREYRLRDAVDLLAQEFGLTDEERQQLTKSKKSIPIISLKSDASSTTGVQSWVQLMLN